MIQKAKDFYGHLLNRQGKRIYISGQITGLDIEVAKMYFKAVQDELEKNGYNAVNPFDILGFDRDHTWHDYMGEDLKVLLHCDGIIMLDNWLNSKGAKCEHDLAKGLGLDIYYCKNHQLF